MAEWEWAGGLGVTWCVYFGAGGMSWVRGQAIFSLATDWDARKLTQRGQISLKVTQWDEGWENPEIQALLQKSTPVGVGGMLEGPQESPVRCLFRGGKAGQGKGGACRALGGWLLPAASCPGPGGARQQGNGVPFPDFLGPELLLKNTWERVPR